MGFVKQPHEIDKILGRMSHPVYGPGEQVTVEFLTDPEVYAALLPPGLSPAARPIASVSAGRWESNCVGPFSGANLSLAVMHRDTPGSWPVAMWMSCDAALAFGREHIGEPKKLAETTVRREGSSVRAEVVRHGIRLVSIVADLPEELPPLTAAGFAFNFRVGDTYTSPGGDVVLTRSRGESAATVRLQGTATLDLTSGPLDPVGDLPVVEILGARYQQHTVRVTTEEVDRVDADAFRPWQLGRMDDPRALG